MSSYGSVEVLKVIFQTLESANSEAHFDGNHPTAQQATEIDGALVFDVPPTPLSPTTDQQITPALLLSHVNDQGQSLFHLAALHGSANVVSYLLNERRSDLLSQTDLVSLLGRKDADGKTVVMVACSGTGYGDDDQLSARRTETVKLLLDSAVSTAPQHASQILKSLLLEHRTTESRNASILAAQNGQHEVLSLLLSYPSSFGDSVSLVDQQLNSTDSHGLNLTSIAYTSHSSKPWLRTRLNTTLALLSSYSCLEKKPLMIATTTARTGLTISLETQMNELTVDEGEEEGSSPGSAVGERDTTGLRKKGSSRG